MLAALYRNSDLRPADQCGHPHGDLRRRSSSSPISSCCSWSARTHLFPALVDRRCGHDLHRACLPLRPAGPHAAAGDPGAHDADDPGGHHQSPLQPLYRDGRLKGIAPGASSCAMPCPMPGRRSPTSSPSISPISSSAWWWWRSSSSIPGIGQLMVDAVSRRDLPVVQGCALIFAATYILLNLAGGYRRHRDESRACCIPDEPATRPARRGHRAGGHRRGAGPHGAPLLLDAGLART